MYYFSSVSRHFEYLGTSHGSTRTPVKVVNKQALKTILQVLKIIFGHILLFQTNYFPKSINNYVEEDKKS